jgi:hypothetical protein
LEDFSFAGCTALSSIVLPEGLTTIGEGAFNGCTLLSSISIPLSVIAIYNDAFSDCTLLLELSSAKGMDVVDFLFWRRDAPLQRYAVLTSLLRLRTELYARPKKRVALEEEDEKEEEEEVVEEGGGGGEQHGAQELQGKLAFDTITSSDVWRCILEFL